MKRRWVVLLLVLVLCIHIPQVSSFAEVPASTTVPADVTEIDLETVIGDEAMDLSDAWMLNADICVMNRRISEGGHHEIILLDVKNSAILSRTPVPCNENPYQGLSGMRREDGIIYLVYSQADLNKDDTYSGTGYYARYLDFNVNIMPDGTVLTSDAVSSHLTVMPDGNNTIREGLDLSLYATNLPSGEEELLIQGVPENGDPSKYVLAWDELPYDVWEAEYEGSASTGDIVYYPYFSNDAYFAIRSFSMYAPIDEHRFIYKVSGWEWPAGYGIYDLETHTNHRITGDGDFFGMRDGMLFGERLMTDASTYESYPLPKTVRTQLKEVAEWMTADLICYDISPDGRLLATSGMKYRFGDEGLWLEAGPGGAPVNWGAYTVSVTNMQTGEIVKTYAIDNPFAREYLVSFYDDTHFMLFCAPAEGGSAYLYLFDVEV